MTDVVTRADRREAALTHAGIGADAEATTDRPAGATLAVVVAAAAVVTVVPMAAHDIARSTGLSSGSVDFLVAMRWAALAVGAVAGAWAHHRHWGRPDVVLIATAATAATTLAAALSTGALLGWWLWLGGAPLGAALSLTLAAAAAGRSDRNLASSTAWTRGAFFGGAAAGPALLLVADAAGLTWRAALLAISVAIAAGAARHGGSTGSPPTIGLREATTHFRSTSFPRRALWPIALAGAALVPLLAQVDRLADHGWHVLSGGRLVALVAALAAMAAGAIVAVPALATARRGGPEALLRLAALALGAGGGLLVLAGTMRWLGPWLVLTIAGLAALGTAVAALDTAVLSSVPLRLRVVAAAWITAVHLALGGVAGRLALPAIERRFGGGWAIGLYGAALLVAARRLTSAVLQLQRDIDRTADGVADELEAVDEGSNESDGRTVRHPLLVCRGIDFSYGSVQVLFGVDFTVDEGEMVALLGTNGAGKSTLLRAISGLGIPDAGSVRFAGNDITFLDAPARVPLGISQIPGGKAVFGPLTVTENLRLYGYTLGRDRAAVENAIATAYAAFPRLDERRDQAASTLSGGEQQMLALSKALMLQPRLLLIDELSLGLAPAVVGELLTMVREINAGGTAVVLVEQSVNIALSLVDHAYFMEKGEMRFDGKASDLLDRPDIVRSVYLQGVAAGLGHATTAPARRRRPTGTRRVRDRSKGRRASRESQP